MGRGIYRGARFSLFPQLTLCVMRDYHFIRLNYAVNMLFRIPVSVVVVVVVAVFSSLPSSSCHFLFVLKCPFAFILK